MACDDIGMPKKDTYLWCAIVLFFCIIFYMRRRIWDPRDDATTLYSPFRPFILPGRISHTRLFPKFHTFSYPYLMVAVPVRSCPSNWLLSIDSADKNWWSRGWLRVEPQDHLGRDDAKSLSQKLDSFLKSQGHDATKYPTVCLVTSPRFLGYKFSPASFWYLYSAENQLTAMIAEVNNTFDERRMYFLESPVSTDKSKLLNFQASWGKDFHVSPFSSRKGSYKLSAADLFNSDGFQGAAAVNINATLLSSKGRSKLVARLWSAAVPLDPAKVSILRALDFLISWSMVGWMTYPHIVIEALKLAKKCYLDIYYRPEPRVGTICRHSTGAERYMGMIFRKYLERILLSSPDAFHLRLIDPTATSNTDNAVSFSTPAADQLSPILSMRILTPKFYYFALNNHGLNSLLVAAFLDPAVENRTAHVDDDATKLVELLTRAAVTMAKEEQAKQSTGRVYLSLLWGFWMTARAKLPFTGVAYPDIGTPAARARTNENRKTDSDSGDEMQNRSYFLDDFMRYSHSPLDQTKYVVWGMGLLAREQVLGIVGGA